MKKKIMFVFGTRPEAIKMAPLIKRLSFCSSNFVIKVCVTAQHRHLLDDVLEVFNIKPDYDLNIMIDNQTLFHITTSAMNRLELVLKKEKPDMVLVHGDTTTSFAAALAAFYLKIPIGHVEAGLRSYDKYNPFPEEINRILSDSICNLHFAPTSTAKKSLLKENISSKSIFITGNTVIDALFMALKAKHKFHNPVLKKLLSCQPQNVYRKLILVTAHRRENFGKPIENICNAIKKIAAKYPETEMVYPVHPNPNITKPVYNILGKQKNIHLVQPLNYLDLVNLMKMSYLVLTDSGGLQEEAPSLGKPVLVMRKVTERPEAVSAGTVKLVGDNEKLIFRTVSKLLSDKYFYNKMSKSVNPYGDGMASDRTIAAIKYFFGMAKNKPKDF